ncbi:hypothetical protein IFM89_031205 [Coptis chinensis]|uniref:GIR1-like zinc ribbon domain-containing protein n=1 Tax=Coptis chinensis TaxID=261450 RepID=A0A835MAG0_9MAGN|nr:hypothetical protein IFM89_031205 [Coptis chinensis]
MEAPDMASITALERSLQNCSLNNRTRSNGSGGGFRSGITSNTPENLSSSTSLELNSHVSLPYHWEQCLDLKTGEIYYINWEDGTKEKEDPRRKCYYFSDDDEEEVMNSYVSDGICSSAASSPSSPLREDEEEGEHEQYNNNVLVVAGCKRCIMYFMLPKRVEECPKCNGLLLHFDRLENGSL